MKSKSRDIIYYAAAGVAGVSALFVCAVLLAAWYAYAVVVLAVAAAVALRILRKAYGVRSVLIWAALFALLALSLTICRSDTAVSLGADYYRSFTRFFMYNYNAATGETYFGKNLSVQASDYEFGQWRAPRGYSNEEIELPHARGDEMLLSDSETVAARMQAAGRDVTLSVCHGMYHTFNIVTPAFRESRAAWKETAEFVNRLKNT